MPSKYTIMFAYAHCGAILFCDATMQPSYILPRHCLMPPLALCCSQNDRSGIRYRQEFADFGIKSHVCGWPDLTEADYKEQIPRQTLRFMGDNASEYTWPHSHPHVSVDCYMGQLRAGTG